MIRLLLLLLLLTSFLKIGLITITLNPILASVRFPPNHRDDLCHRSVDNFSL